MARKGETSDGRFDRSVRTRAKIAAACIELVREGNLSPTSEDVALRAEVGHRTVFRHFQDMESLLREIQSQVEAAMIKFIRPETEGDFQARLTTLVKRRGLLYEETTNFRLSTMVRIWQSPFLQRSNARYQSALWASAQASLPELAKAPANVRAAIRSLLAFSTWYELRHEQELSVRQAARVLVQSIETLLGKTG